MTVRTTRMLRTIRMLRTTRTIRDAVGAGTWVICASAGLHCSSGGSDAASTPESAKDGSTRAGGDDAASDAATGSQGPETNGASMAEGGGGSDGGALEPPAGCKASCAGKTCGDDGCNGTCGALPPVAALRPFVHVSDAEHERDRRRRTLAADRHLAGHLRRRRQQRRLDADRGAQPLGRRLDRLLQLEERHLQLGHGLELRQLQGPLHFPVAIEGADEQRRPVRAATTSRRTPTRS